MSFADWFYLVGIIFFAVCTLWMLGIGIMIYILARKIQQLQKNIPASLAARVATKVIDLKPFLSFAPLVMFTVNRLFRRKK